MDKLTISIFGNKIFPEIINEIKLFSQAKIKYYEDLNSCINEAEGENCLLVFFVTDLNKDYFSKIKVNNLPIILISQPSVEKNLISSELVEKLNIPFAISDFNKKIISLNAKNKFKKNSLINLNDYVIDKNERKIKKNNLELQLSEKEINFLILFTKTKKPITKDIVLQNVWNYSPESETHTVETHIHRLRKKILEKFGDKDFIKNSDQGYYI